MPWSRSCSAPWRVIRILCSTKQSSSMYTPSPACHPLPVPIIKAIIAAPAHQKQQCFTTAVGSSWRWNTYRPAIAAMVVASAVSLSCSAIWGGKNTIALQQTDPVAVVLCIILFALLRKKSWDRCRRFWPAVLWTPLSTHCSVQVYKV